ncbi:hypothetical protein NKG05_16795 [Oerskovia sp. M15]
MHGQPEEPDASGGPRETAGPSRRRPSRRSRPRTSRSHSPRPTTRPRSGRPAATFLWGRRDALGRRRRRLGRRLPRQDPRAVRARLGDGQEIRLEAYSLAGEDWNLFYVEGLAIVDPESQQRLSSYREADREKGESAFQTCSAKPKSLGAEKFPQTCVLPALDPATKTVTLEIPDLPAIENVPVTRHGSD